MKPLLLVPVQQVENLFAHVNRVVDGACISLSAIRDELGLTLTFDNEHPRLRPRYLGWSASQSQFKDLERYVPGYKYHPTSESDPDTPPKDDDLTTFSRKLDAGFDLCRARKASKAARKEQRITKQQDWRRDLKQTERFLGLRPPVVEGIFMIIPFIFLTCQNADRLYSPSTRR